MSKLGKEKMDRYVKEMREAGCIVIVYTPEDVRNCLAELHQTDELDKRVSLMDVATDVHEDDAVWDAMSEAVNHAYVCLVEGEDDYERQQAREEVNNG
jgi:hypothetical protein